MTDAFPSLAELAAVLGGKVSGRQVLAPGPGHKPSDRSMAVRPEANAEDGFVVYSHSNDDWRACRDHVRQRLGLPDWNGAAAENKTTTAADLAARSEAVALDEAARVERQARAAHEASAALKKAKKAKPDCAHPYLAKKKIQPSGAHVTDDGKLLVVPMRDIDGLLHNVQCISANGEKRFVFGGRVAGCFYTLGKKPRGSDTIYITEGFATGATVCECMGAAVAVAFNCGNLAAVATALRSKFPTAQLVLCADDDAGTHGNPGLTKAREAASVVQGLVAIPEFGADRPEGATDFNDMQLYRGGDAVRDCIEATAQTLRNGQDKTASGAGAGEQPAPDGAPPNGHPLPKLTPIRFVTGEIVRPREWIVRGWIPTRKVTLLQGDGGLGKSPLMQQLQSSCATAFPWLGLGVEECTSIGVYTEDEEQDLKERQAAIDEVYGCACVETGKMHLFPRVEEENELVVFDRARKPVLTTFYRQVCEAALDLRVRLVVLDVAVDFYGGNEIARQEVRAFFRPLGNLARQIDGGVVLTSHVSQAGIRSDGGHSASTDWSNYVRARNYLNRPKDEDGNEIVDARLLTRKKATYASIGDTIKLHWEKGLILPDGSSMSSHFRNSVEDVFLALLDALTREGQNVSAKPRAGNYAPALFMRRKPNERQDYRRVDFERAMQDLLRSRRIKIAPYGKPSTGLERLVRADEEDAS